METYKKGSQSEIQTIEHIKFIAQGLFKDSEPEKYSEFTYHGKGKGKQREASSNEFAPSVMYRQEMEMQYESPKDHAKKGQRELPSTLPSKKSISRKRPIFSNFDEFWVKCSQSPERKATTPLIDRINKRYQDFNSAFTASSRPRAESPTTSPITSSTPLKNKLSGPIFSRETSSGTKKGQNS
jgi:hypothetical protein